MLFGTDEQKARYYPDLATGKRIAAFCLTEPGSGSDASSIRTTAERDGDHWVLNGEKLWITNGGIAELLHGLRQDALSEATGKMTAFLVTPEMGGVTPGPHEDKMGIRASSHHHGHLRQHARARRPRARRGGRRLQGRDEHLEQRPHRPRRRLRSAR